MIVAPAATQGNLQSGIILKCCETFFFFLFLFVHPQARIIDCQTVITSPRNQLHVKSDLKEEVQRNLKWERERDDLSVCSAGKRN